MKKKAILEWILCIKLPVPLRRERQSGAKDQKKIKARKPEELRNDFGGRTDLQRRRTYTPVS
jgi:hypothetical protein